MLQRDASPEALAAMVDRLRQMPMQQRYTMATAATCAFSQYLSTLSRIADSIGAVIHRRNVCRREDGGMLGSQDCDGAVIAHERAQSSRPMRRCMSQQAIETLVSGALEARGRVDRWSRAYHEDGGPNFRLDVYRHGSEVRGCCWWVC